MPNELRAAVKIPATAKMPPAEALNFVTFAWQSGVEVEMLAGYVDLFEFRDAGKKDLTVIPQVTHRFFMSMRGFALLRAQVLEASAKLIAAGVPLDDLNPMAKETGARA